MPYCKYGGKRKEKPVYNNIQFDSTEEMEFYYWLEEALKLGYIEDLEFHNQVFKLFEKSRVPCSKTIRKQGFVTLQDCEYELDFRFKPTLKLENFEHGLVPNDDGWVYVDTKGTFKGNDTVFSIKQKLMYLKYSIYINRVVPIKYFAKTWLPERAGLTKVKKDRQKSYLRLKTYKELNQ